MAAAVMREAKARGFEIKILDIGGGFPSATTARPPHRRASEKDQRRNRPPVPRRSRDPGRARPFPGGHRGLRRRPRHRKAVRDAKTCYYIDDSVYHTFSGIILRPLPVPHQCFQKGPPKSAPSSPNCDGLDTIPSEELAQPGNRRSGLLRQHRAYSNASATWFNGFPQPKWSRHELWRGMSGRALMRRWRRKILSRSAYQPTAVAGALLERVDFFRRMLPGDLTSSRVALGRSLRLRQWRA